MKKPTVYIESTVISYYTARRSRDIIVAAHQEITLVWWENVLPQLHPFISQIVFDEIERGDKSAADRRLKKVKDFDILEVKQEIVILADEYYKVLDIPQKARNDSFHLAIAVYHGLDYLVTWNCTHIAAGRVRSIIESLNHEKGYMTPVICTPEELMEV
jgi:predicted nucleic acid-binding protein